MILCGDSSLPDEEWHHLAMRKTGHSPARVDLWLDGTQVETGGRAFKRELNFDRVFGVGQFGDAAAAMSDSQGTLDEVAIFQRALGDTELEDLFYRSVQKLRFQVRVCGEPDCGDARFVGPDADPETYYEDTTDAAAEAPVSLDGLIAGRYFQYQVFFDTVESAPSPQLLRVRVDTEQSSGT